MCTVRGMTVVINVQEMLAQVHGALFCVSDRSFGFIANSVLLKKLKTYRDVFTVGHSPI